MLILVALGSLSARAAGPSPVDAKVLQDRYQQVVMLPAIERERLQRNLAEFQKMSPAEQEKCRELNRQLQDNGTLATLMQTYSAWLQTLTPGQREELRQEKDSQKKLALVTRFKKEQYHPIEMFTDASAESGHPEPPKPLASGELSAMIKVLVADLPKEVQASFAKASSASQYIEIWKNDIQSADGGANAWPSQELQTKLIESLKREERRNSITSRKPHEREVLAEMLCWGIWNHALEEVRSKIPRDSELEKVLNKLDGEEKSRLEKLPLQRRRRELARHYFEQRGDDTFRQLNNLRFALDRLMLHLNLPLPPQMREGFGPPPRRGEHGGPPDERGNPPPGDRPPGDRPPGGRPPFPRPNGRPPE